MNPEEGDIRPQLLDRFALSVKVAGEQNPEKRAEIVKRRLAYEADSKKFIAQISKDCPSLKESIIGREIQVKKAITASTGYGF